MTDLSNTFNPTDVNRKYLDDKVIQICEYCRGTGVSPKYEKVNKIINAILDYSINNCQAKLRPKSVAPYCLNCFGKGSINRIQINNKNYNKKNADEVRNNKSCSNFYSDIGIFLIYVSNFEKIYDCDKEIELHYNLCDDKWEEYIGSYDVAEAKRSLLRWGREFQKDGYFEEVESPDPSMVHMYCTTSHYFDVKILFKKGIGLEIKNRYDICDCCYRHYTEGKRHRILVDPLKGEYTELFLFSVYRDYNPNPPPYDDNWIGIEEVLKRIGREDLKELEQWHLEEYNEEKREAMEDQYADGFYTSWECPDCAYLSLSEYYEKYNKNKLPLRL